MQLPVMKSEVLGYLDPKPNEDFIDCTVGEGGHAKAILEKNSPEGRVLGIDCDPSIIENLKNMVKGTPYEQRLIPVCGNYVNLSSIAKEYGFASVAGVLFDLGLSTWHIEESGRGFSFYRNEPLDMRYSPENPLTAEKILNFWQVREIERILRVYGQERFAHKIAMEIAESRPLKTTLDLVMAIERATPRWYHRRRIHFATKAFQALRIAVNKELENFERGLPQTLEVIKSCGRLVIISFHSLEDRIAKNFLKEKSREGLIKILTKKPLRPSHGEVAQNPRARSARLRAAQKL
ncbi:MAG: 16S rRNA (cytosine(1402)-N(4))-methyltransferase RsmH [Candidatus Bathyarchaeia archaeon]